MSEVVNMTDEMPAFWHKYSKEHLATVAAHMHSEHRRLLTEVEHTKIISTRLAMASWLQGSGVEVGAGARPFDVPARLSVIYGDVRDAAELKEYFGGLGIWGGDRRIDAQTFSGIPDEVFDFVISAHVIEHLCDPVGAIENTLRVLRKQGLFLLVVPDMRFTFDRARPETTLEHVLKDYEDGGKATLAQAHEEHIRYVHTLSGTPFPEDQIPLHVANNLGAGMDIHIHAWTDQGFRLMLEKCSELFAMRIEAQTFAVNENLFAIRKL